MPAYPRNRNGLAAPLVAQLTALLLAVPSGCVSTPGIDTSAMSFSHEPLVGKVILPPSPQLRDGNMAVVTDPTGALFALQKVSS